MGLVQGAQCRFRHAGQFQCLSPLLDFGAGLGVAGAGLQIATFGDDTFGFQLTIPLQRGPGEIQTAPCLQVESLCLHQLRALDVGQWHTLFYGIALGDLQSGEQAILRRADDHELCIGYAHLGREGGTPDAVRGLYRRGLDSQCRQLFRCDLDELSGVGDGGQYDRQDQWNRSHRAMAPNKWFLRAAAWCLSSSRSFRSREAWLNSLRASSIW